MTGGPFPDFSQETLPQEKPDDVGTLTQTATDANATITAAQMLGGLYDRKGTFTAGRTDTFDSAANLVAAISNAKVNDIIEVVVANHNAAVQNLVLAGGTGGTHLGAAGDLTLAQNAFSTWKFILTNVGSGTEAYSFMRSG